MKFEGYTTSGYDLTYKKSVFNVIERNGVLEITDVESGTTFVIEINLEDEEVKADRIRAWRENEVQGQGLSIVFGSKGLMQQLKYGGRKPKPKTRQRD